MFILNVEGVAVGEWTPVSNLEQEKAKAVEAAKNTLNKDRRVNLRLTEKDYHRVKIKATEEGMPYQTLIASIVHKYLDGSLT